MPPVNTRIASQIAAELKVRDAQVQAAIDLLDGGATVPFVARYRKEATGGLDDVQLRELETRLTYLRELHERRAAILKSVLEQGKLTPELAAAIEAAPTKQELEDLYLPYKPKRRTKGQIAREAGLEPLADALFANPALDPAAEALAYLKPAGSVEGADFSTPQAVLDGVRDILSERWAEDAALVQGLREWLWEEGQLQSRLAAGKSETEGEAPKFRDYFEYDEPIGRVPSHRALAVFRGRALEILDVKLAVPEAEPPPAAAQTIAKTAVPSLAEGRLAQHLGWRHQGGRADDLWQKCRNCPWKVMLGLSPERDLFTRLREAAEQTAIKVFADNLRDLLLAAPAGAKAVMGLDPGIRTGVKVAVVDATGKLLETATVFPHEPRRDWDGALATLGRLVVKHGVQLIAIGNGTASRETDKLAGELIKLVQKTASDHTGQPPPAIEKIVVSEAGASVYSASEYASQEMPDVDVSLRGAASIARRLQDPLAELVKIDPKSIGVGQYQHDVSQLKLARGLDAVVEDCVNAVGVDVNTASVALLARISGLNTTLAQNIVPHSELAHALGVVVEVCFNALGVFYNTASPPLLERVSGLSKAQARAVVRWREANGAFRDRQQLMQVAGLGAKTFEQSAGFLRIRGGDNPLDMTGVHPESYPVVARMLQALDKPVEQVMGRAEALKGLKAERFAADGVGAITVKDILAELEKPGRDPRPHFAVARFNDGVEDIADLKPGMLLEGTVSNVAAFGAFVDLGVHQDGLVHVSQLANKFVQDAREIVKTGQVVKVKVLEVDVPRKRISLTMRLDAQPTRSGGPRENRYEAPGRGAHRHAGQGAGPAAGGTAMASAFEKLRGLRG